MSEVVKIVTPTYKRADRVLVTKAIANTTLCVASSEEAEYREHNPDVEIMVHPDSIRGYTPKAAWIKERVPNLFLLDDDCIAMQRRDTLNPDGKLPTKIDRNTAYDLVQTTAATAEEMGAHLFGFGSIANPLTFHGFQPFRYKGFVIGGACGWIEGGGLDFDESLVLTSDYYMALLNAYRNRFCFVDERFSFVFKDTFCGTGGVSEYRNNNTEEQDFHRLKALFGEAIQLKGNAPASVRKKRSNFEKTMRLPW